MIIKRKENIGHFFDGIVITDFEPDLSADRPSRTNTLIVEEALEEREVGAREVLVDGELLPLLVGRVPGGVFPLLLHDDGSVVAVEKSRYDGSGFALRTREDVGELEKLVCRGRTGECAVLNSAPEYGRQCHVVDVVTYLHRISSNLVRERDVVESDAVVALPLLEVVDVAVQSGQLILQPPIVLLELSVVLDDYSEVFFQIVQPLVDGSRGLFL